MREEGIFTTHLTGTQLSLLTFLMRDIELGFNSARPDYKLGYQVISLVWVRLTSGHFPLYKIKLLRCPSHIKQVHEEKASKGA